MENSKKIALVTFVPNSNFGTCLQSYALNKTLRDLGCSVIFIYNGREVPPRNFFQILRSFVRRFIPDAMIKSIRGRNALPKLNNKSVKEPDILEIPYNTILYYLSKIPFYNAIYKWYTCPSTQLKKVYSFTFDDGNYEMRRLYRVKDYEKVEKDVDVFLTGSDQIWNPFCGGFNPFMFLEFVKNKPRVAYSSSMAVAEIPNQVKERIKADLSFFYRINVREKSTVLLLRNLLNKDNIHLVLDPTYLLSSEEWLSFGNKAKIEFAIPPKYIFCYFVGSRFKDYQQMVDEVKQKTNIENVITVQCYGYNVTYGGGILYKDAGPYEFIYLLSHASFVCMDSFHATVFALKFNLNSAAL